MAESRKWSEAEVEAEAVVMVALAVDEVAGRQEATVEPGNWGSVVPPFSGQSLTLLDIKDPEKGKAFVYSFERKTILRKERNPKIEKHTKSWPMQVSNLRPSRY